MIYNDYKKKRLAFRLNPGNGSYYVPTLKASPRGFTLLIAVVLSSVALSIGLALLDISYKQVVLASAAKQSQIAFYAADSVLECALYYDQQLDTFNYATQPTSGTLTCNNLSSPYTAPIGSNPRITTVTVPCLVAGVISGEQGVVKVYKWSTGTTNIFATGYNSCDTTNTRRIERGLKIAY